MAVSIAALLFAGCGGSRLSPAQQERCDDLQRVIDAIDAEFSNFKFEVQMLALERKEKAKKERAALGC
ncbi:hypothetical protein MCEKE4_00294 [Acidimicrobiia bacterium]